MTVRLMKRLVVAGGFTAAIGLSPAAVIAQTNIGCPAIGAPACSTFNIPISVSEASGSQSAGVTNSGNDGPSFVVSAPQQAVGSTSAAQSGSQNGSSFGDPRVAGGAGGGTATEAARHFTPTAALGVGGAANTGGAAL